MSSVADYYAPGSYNDPSAPWNEPIVPEEDFEITCSQSLSKTVTVTTNNYIPGASGVDYERDDEGGTYASSWHDDPDTSDTNWAEEYHSNHYTPLQLLEILKGYITKDLVYGGSKYSKRQLEHLLEECGNWVEDDTEYIKN